MMLRSVLERSREEDVPPGSWTRRRATGLETTRVEEVVDGV